MTPGDVTATTDKVKNKDSKLNLAKATILVSREKFSSTDGEGGGSSEPLGSSRGADGSDDEDNDSDIQQQLHTQLRDELNKYLERTPTTVIKATAERRRRNRPRKAARQLQTPSIGTDEDSNMSNEQQYNKKVETPIGPSSTRTTRSKKRKHGEEQLDR